MAAALKIPPEYLPTFGSSEESGRPHVDIYGPYYYYAVRERADELSHKIESDLHDLSYWIARDATFSMASEFSRTHRESHQDFRRLLFEHQLELIGRLSSEWQARLRKEIEEILAVFPYNDLP
jgi:hypothetical protein